MARDNKGSSVASISYWIPSSNTARPSEMFLVSSLIQCFWLMLMGERLSPWDPLIQLEPWSCGSIKRGHLEQDVIIDAFSKDMLSAGRPSFFHLAFRDSVVNILSGSIPSVNGISLLTMLGSQISCQSYLLSFDEKAPMYETNSLARSTSPMTLLMLAFKNCTFSLQRLFSPARPLTSFSAAVNFFWHLSASYSTSFFCFSAAANFSFNLSTFSFNWRTCSFTIASSFIALSRSSLALSLASCRGLTFL